MRMEVALLFDRVLRENRSVLELLNGTDTFVNERLARLYGIEGISGAEFRAVALKDRRRGGLLGSAAILSATSLATRTSPVRRGQFVLETLLGVDLPPPPANVPELAENAGESKELSVRKSLALHRDNPSCAGCHSKIDPLGFALENFDWIGRWREKDPSGPVDASGALPNGRQLNGIADLKSYLVKERADDFLRALTESMLAFALGRELEYFDEHAIRGLCVLRSCGDSAFLPGLSASEAAAVSSSRASPVWTLCPAHRRQLGDGNRAFLLSVAQSRSVIG